MMASENPQAAPKKTTFADAGFGFFGYFGFIMFAEIVSHRVAWETASKPNASSGRPTEACMEAGPCGLGYTDQAGHGVPLGSAQVGAAAGGIGGKRTF